MALTAVARVILLTLVAAIGIYGQRAPFTWSPTGPMETPRHSACVVRLPDGRVLISGGISKDGTVASAEMYSKEGGWFRAAAMNQPRAMHTCSVLLDGRVLVTGGAAGEPAAEIYDPPLDTWTPLVQGGIARWNHTASALGDGRILLAGGVNADGPLNALEIFELASGTIVSAGVSAAPRARSCHRQLRRFSLDGLHEHACARYRAHVYFARRVRHQRICGEELHRPKHHDHRVRQWPVAPRRRITEDFRPSSRALPSPSAFG